jgi:hypothetical protein
MNELDPFKAHLCLPGSRPFFETGDSVSCEWVDQDLRVARLADRPFANYEFGVGDLVVVDEDVYGHWHIIGRAPTA